ncbi:hemerythrin domain-containing protein [soil metagenome]
MAHALHFAPGMQRISDALELLTAQHDEIEALLAEIATSGNTGRRALAITELADAVTVHLAAEQELFYPAVAADISPAVHAELLAENSEIKRLLADLVWLEHGDNRLERKLVALRTLVDHHVTWQENELFEAVAERHSEQELAAIGGAMRGWIDSLVVYAAA